MKLLLSIVLFALLGYFLFIMGPIFGGCIAFGIVVGSLVKGVSLLSEIHKRLGILAPTPDTDSKKVVGDDGPSSHLKDKDTYLKYLKEKNNLS